MTFRPKTARALALITALHVLRLILPVLLPSNLGFSPVFAAAMLAGATLGLPLALLTTLFLTAAGDLLVQHFVYHDVHGFPIYPGWEWVYGSIALAVCAGWLLRDERFGWLKAAGLSVVVVIAHWLMADTGVWVAGGCGADCVREYTRDFAGFSACLGAAIPNEIRLFAATVIFGSVTVAVHRLEPKTRKAEATAMPES